MSPEHTKTVRELLAFYIEAGVDAVVGDEAPDRFADDIGDTAALAAAPNQTRRRETSADAPRAAPPSQVAADPAAAVFTSDSPQGGIAAPEVAIMAAREAAKSAASLDELRSILEGFDGCALKSTAKQLVFADGTPGSRIMLVGEAPGRDEDIQGLPFVGRSGQLLDRMLKAIGLDRSSVYIANIIPWRPPGNRTPTPQESQTCLPFILRQIELANPDILVCLGGPSAQTLLGIKDGILKTRGRWFTHRTGTREIRAIATLHPAYLLRQPLQKRLAWRDFLAIKKALA